MKSLIAMFLVASLAGCAQIKVDKVESYDPVAATGIVYALPKTIVRLDLKVDHVTYEEGKYAEFKKIFAPDADDLCKEKSEGRPCPAYVVQDTATIATYGRPDPDNLYMVNFLTGGFLTDQTMTMSWAENGLVSGTAASVTNRSIDVAISTIKLAASVGTKAVTGGAGFTPATVKGAGLLLARRRPNTCDFDPAVKGRLQQTPLPNDDWVIGVLIDKTKGSVTDAVIANYCSLSNAERSRFTDRKRLESAASFYTNKIGDLAANRDSLLAGTQAVLDIVATLGRLESQIDKNINAAFVGTKKTKTWNVSADVRTDKLRLGTDIEVLRWDPAFGACLGNDVEQVPASADLPESFNDSTNFRCNAGKPATGGLRTALLKVALSPAAAEQVFTRVKDVVDGSDRSFRYRIPAQVLGTLTSDTKPLAASQFSVAQFGTVISLPAKRSTKALTYDLGFIEATGALKSFKLVTSGAADSSGSIDALSGAAGTVLDARSAARAAKSESAQNEALYKELKLRDDICTLQTKLGLQCTTPPQ